MSKKDKIKELLKLFDPPQKKCRMVIPTSDGFYTDLVETKAIEIWQREYQTVIIAKEDMHGLIYLWNFDPPPEAVDLLSKQGRSEEEEKLLDKLLDETIKNPTD